MNEQLFNIFARTGNGILYFIQKPDLWFYGVMGIFLTMGFFAGNRLTVIQAPERPLLSPVLRTVGSSLSLMSKALFWLVFAIIGALSFFTYPINAVGHAYLIIQPQLLWIMGGMVIGSLFSIPVNYRWLPLWERGAGVDDIHRLADRLANLARAYNPEKWIDIKKGVFCGLDERRRPVYIAQNVIQKNHIQLLGVSGSGKSSLAGLILSQCSMNKESVVVYDPKDDEFLAGVLARMATKAGIKFHLIDLRPNASPQINPLYGCMRWEVEELLTAAFELGKSGDAAVDFHRGEDRDACMETAAIYENGEKSLPTLFMHCASRESITSRTNFWREFRHLASLQALHAEKGLDLARAIEDGDTIYIIGSTTSDKVFSAQKMLLQRVLQIISARPREDARHVAIMIDELKYLLSVPAIRALGTIRDRRCHMIVAHQSLGDLEDCAGLDPKAVYGAIHGNTNIKVVYRINEQKTAEEFEGISGKERTFIEATGISDNGLSGHWREAERPKIRADALTHLPKPSRGESSVGVVFGLGTAFYLSSRYLKSGKKPSITHAEISHVLQNKTNLSAEDLI